MQIMRLISLCLVAAVLVPGVSYAEPAPFIDPCAGRGQYHDSVKERMNKHFTECMAIPMSETSDGLFFNPKGMTTSYKRSRCLSDLAGRFLNAGICEKVVERNFLFQDGSYYTPDACRARVEALITSHKTNTITPDKIRRLASGEVADSPNGPTLVLKGTDGLNGKYLFTYEVAAIGKPDTRIYVGNTMITYNSDRTVDIVLSKLSKYEDALSQMRFREYEKALTVSMEFIDDTAGGSPDSVCYTKEQFKSTIKVPWQW